MLLTIKQLGRMSVPLNNVWCVVSFWTNAEHGENAIAGYIVSEEKPLSEAKKCLAPKTKYWAERGAQYGVAKVIRLTEHIPSLAHSAYRP